MGSSGQSWPSEEACLRIPAMFCHCLRAACGRCSLGTDVVINSRVAARALTIGGHVPAAATGGCYSSLGKPRWWLQLTLAVQTLKSSWSQDMFGNPSICESSCGELVGVKFHPRASCFNRPSDRLVMAVPSRWGSTCCHIYRNRRSGLESHLYTVCLGQLTSFSLIFLTLNRTLPISLGSCEVPKYVCSVPRTTPDTQWEFHKWWCSETCPPKYNMVLRTVAQTALGSLFPPSKTGQHRLTSI